MRLIDADTVKAVFEEKSSVAVCGVELCKAIIRRIDEAPTVDAIPIKWMIEQAENPSNSDAIRNALDHIVYALWRKDGR